MVERVIYNMYLIFQIQKKKIQMAQSLSSCVLILLSLPKQTEFTAGLCKLQQPYPYVSLICFAIPATAICNPKLARQVCGSFIISNQHVPHVFKCCPNLWMVQFISLFFLLLPNKRTTLLYSCLPAWSVLLFLCLCFG